MSVASNARTTGRVRKRIASERLSRGIGFGRALSEADAFVFPREMPAEEAQGLLQEAYGEIDEGKLLRRTNKELRRRGIDPPMDVQYVAEPAVQRFSDGLGIT